MRFSKRVLWKVGVFPIIDHYYEPSFKPTKDTYLYEKDRQLPGIDYNINEQLEIIRKFHYNEELKRLPIEKQDDLHFYYNNPYFRPGDAEFLYNMIRLFKPKRIIEIGSGFTTLLMISALAMNNSEDPNYKSELLSIEPYENLWLEKIGVNVLREKVEESDISIFKELNENDFLFIDSSHIVRPEGDVLFEFLYILPILKKGVIVHVHDIFTPKHYPTDWLFNHVRLWNEQYFLEAFLTMNKGFRIIGALNLLKNEYFVNLVKKCPILQKEPNNEPGSFWLVRN